MRRPAATNPPTRWLADSNCTQQTNASTNSHILIPATSNESYDTLPHLRRPSASIMDRVIPPPVHSSTGVMSSPMMSHKSGSSTSFGAATVRNRTRTASHDSEVFSTDNDDQSELKWYYQNLPDSLRPLRMPAATATSSTSPRQSGADVRLRQRPKEYVVSRFDYEAKEPDELSLKRGSVIKVVSKDPHISGGIGWWAGEDKESGKTGAFPANIVDVDTNTAIDTLVQEEDVQTEPPDIRIQDLEFFEMVGSGGFGRVFRAKWKSTEKIVAIKIANCNQGDDTEQIIQSVKQEARLFYMLKHDHIVSLHGVCLDAPNYGLVLEHCAGGPLNRLIATNKIPPYILIDWAIQIATGMQYLHDLCRVTLVHRDLKSGNVLIKEPLPYAMTSGGLAHTPCTPVTPTCLHGLTLKITDFGLARPTDHTTRMSMCGTYAWMAPEVITNQTFSKASDVWRCVCAGRSVCTRDWTCSYGVLLWELLTSEIPYHNLESLCVAYGVAHAKFSLPIPETCPSDALRQILKSCWERDPCMRPSFNTILHVLDDINKDMVDMDETDFHKLQETWKEDIAEVFTLIKSKETQLQDIERTLHKQRMDQETRQRLLEEREETLRRQAQELAEQQEMMNLQVTMQKLKPPELPAKRPGKFTLHRHRKAIKANVISEPTDFRHQMTVLPRPQSESPPGSPHRQRPAKNASNLVILTKPADGAANPNDKYFIDNILQNATSAENSMANSTLSRSTAGRSSNRLHTPGKGDRRDLPHSFHPDATPHRGPSIMSANSQTPLLHPNRDRSVGRKISPSTPSKLQHITNALARAAIVLSAVVDARGQSVKRAVDARHVLDVPVISSVKSTTPSSTGSGSTAVSTGLAVLANGGQPPPQSIIADQWLEHNWRTTRTPQQQQQHHNRSGTNSETSTPMSMIQSTAINFTSPFHRGVGHRSGDVTSPPTVVSARSSQSASALSKYATSTPVSPANGSFATETSTSSTNQASMSKRRVVPTPHTKTYTRNARTPTQLGNQSTSLAAHVQPMSVNSPMGNIRPVAGQIPPSRHHSGDLLATNSTNSPRVSRSSALNFVPPVPPGVDWALPKPVFNPGYESSPKNNNHVAVRAGTRAPTVDPAGPERPSTLNLAADPPTPAESGIATTGSSIASSTFSTVVVPPLHASLDHNDTPPIPPRTASRRPPPPQPQHSQHSTLLTTAGNGFDASTHRANNPLSPATHSPT